jgi:hypothetical protein
MRFDKLIKQILKESTPYDGIVFIGFTTNACTAMSEVEAFTLEQARRELSLEGYETGDPYFLHYEADKTKPVNNDNDLRDCMSETINNLLDYIEGHGEDESLTEAEVRDKVLGGFEPYLEKGLTGTWWFSGSLYGLLISYSEYRSQQINQDLQDVDTTGFEDLL